MNRLTNFTFRIDDETERAMRQFPDFNWSKFFRVKGNVKAHELTRLRERRFPEDFPWRTTKYKGDMITVNAKPGEYGPTDWSLKIQTSEIGDRAISVKLGGMPELDRIIEGVADYYYHKTLRERGIDLSKTVSKQALAGLWLEIAELAREYKLELSARVALLPSQPIRVRGRHGQELFDDEVIPKDWGNVKKEDRQMNVFFSNFWIGSYAETQGTVFRLSSYLKRQYKNVSAKTATRYIDFEPDNQLDTEEIRKIIADAKVVYLPDLSIRNVRSLFFETKEG